MADTEELIDAATTLFGPTTIEPVDSYAADPNTGHDATFVCMQWVSDDGHTVFEVAVHDNESVSVTLRQGIAIVYRATIRSSRGAADG